MKLSTVHKQRLAKIARVASAGALVVGSVATSLPASSVDAASLTANKTTLSNSRPSPGATNVTYTVSFTPTVSTTPIGAVDIEFCTTANTFGQNCTAPTSFSIDNGTIDASSTAQGFGDGAGNAGTFSAPSANVARYVTDNEGGEDETAVAHILTIASSVTNPSVPGTYFARLRTFSDAAASTPIDDGTSAFAIVQSVQVEGRVLESMTFTVNGVPTTTACGTGENSNISTSATSVNFGNYSTTNPRIGCQTVTTATNAQTGFTTTLQQYTAGTAPVGAMCRQTAPDCTNDGGQSGVLAGNTIANAGGLTNTPASWTPGTTFGLGVSANGAEKATQFTNATEFRGFYNGSDVSEAVQIAAKSSPSNGVATYVVFKSDVPSSQTAGVYQNRLIYNSVPTF